MSNIAEKLTTIAENELKIYEKGMSDNESEFWDGIQKHGARVTYTYGFYYWEDIEYLRPKYKIVPTSTLYNMFNACRKLKKIEAEYFDFSQANVTAATNASGLHSVFAYCNELEEIEDIGMKAGGYNLTFAHCYALKKIAKLRITEECGIVNPFVQCTSLEEITFEGTIAQNISFKDSPLLSNTSLENIAQHLKDFLPEWKEGDGNKAIITFHATVKERIKNTEIENLIKSKKWGIA